MVGDTAQTKLFNRSEIELLRSLDADFLLPADCNGKRGLVLCDPRVHELHRDALTPFKDKRRFTDFVALDGEEPHAAQIESVAEHARDLGAEFVVSIGGGSTIDTGKAVCQLVAGRATLPISFERPGRFSTACPHLVFPTTAGPGAEVSPAMIFTGRTGNKLAVVDARLVPRRVYIVPSLAITLPPAQTVCCLLDGIAHALEAALRPDAGAAAYAASSMVLGGFVRLADSVGSDPTNLLLREQLSVISVLSGEALRLSAVAGIHSLAGAIATLQTGPHGMIVASSLLALLEEPSNSPSRLQSLVAQLGFSGPIGLYESLHTLWRKHVAPQAPIAEEPDHAMVNRCAELMMADSRVAFHWESLDLPRAERAARRALCLYSDASRGRNTA